MTRKRNKAVSKIIKVNTKVENESDNSDSESLEFETSDEESSKNIDSECEEDVEEEESVDHHEPENRLSDKNNESFSTLKGKVSDETLKAIDEMGFTQMTEIQEKAIPPLLDGKDLVGNAKTGSGKTLAFLIPVVELIVKSKFKPKNGTGCIIISPTRELATETYSVLQELMKYHRNTHGIVMDGAYLETETKKLQNGINILVATPGRLLEHLQNTPGFVYKNLMSLVIDEVDRIIETGSEDKLKQIINLLPSRKLTILFSSISTKKTKYFARLAIKTKPVYVNVQDSLDKPTVKGLEQYYVVCPPEKRFLFLFTILKKNQNKKMMVFFSSCLSVKFHDMLLNHLDIPVRSIHGKQEQKMRSSIFSEFCNAKSGILLCTDVVARDLDIPAVDWIVQYDPPDDHKEYIHRAGRAARSEGESGHALLLLRPEEVSFLKYLKNNKISVNVMDFKWNKVVDIQLQLEKLIRTNYALNIAANDAFKSCLISYDSHHLKKFFNINKINFTKLAKNFGLTVPPRVDLSINTEEIKKPLKRNGEGDENQQRAKKPYKFIQPKRK